MHNGISETEVSGTDTVKLIFDSNAAAIVGGRLQINNSAITLVEENY